MNIALIDSDLLDSNANRFPNLALMKLSKFYSKRGKGNTTKLILDYKELKETKFDKIFLSKVFTKTKVPDWVMKLPNLEYGGTGFFYDKAPNLPEEIEHSKPDYNLYNEFVENQLAIGKKPRHLRYYTDYMIGFMTRGCFRKCSFCINRNYDKVENHSNVLEWKDSTRKKICLLDDNFLGYSGWKQKLSQLKRTKKPFQFKQGFDIRLITDESAKLLSECRIDETVYFSFDNIEDKKIITEKIGIWRKHNPKKNTIFHVFCGFDRDGKYNDEFYKQDLISLFERIKILMQNKCCPYIMRHEDYVNSPFRGIYVAVSQWCNQVSLYTKMSLNELIDKQYNLYKQKANNKYRNELKEIYPEIVEEYFDMKYENQ